MKKEIIIPENELEITAARSGGPGGQHVNKTSTKIILRWNIPNTNALNPEEKERLIEKLKHRLTNEGDLIIHSSSSRSQEQNKKNAFAILGQEIRKALYIPKKRKPTKISKGAKEARLFSKKSRSNIKRLRRSKSQEE